jgi:hypothetical protein
VLAVLCVILEQRRSSPAVETPPAAVAAGEGALHRYCDAQSPHKPVPGVRSRTNGRTEFPVLRRSPSAANIRSRTENALPETPGGDFASVLGSTTPASVRRQGIHMTMKRDCPQCRSIETSRSRRRGTVERYLLTVIGLRPFRCLNCDARFYAFACFDEETSLNDKAARGVFSRESI